MKESLAEMNSSVAAEIPSHRLVRALETMVAISAIATIPLTLVLEQQPVPIWAHAADWICWSVFLIEYLVLFAVSDSKWHYFSSTPINLSVVILSFPQLPVMLGLVRVVRLIRFFRLFRLIGVSGRAITALGAVLGRTGFVYVASISLIVVLAGGASLALLEPQTVHGGFGEGVWWAIVTATTVGYGDIAPVTFWGRAIAVLLMVTGVGLMSTLAASITAHFLAHEENSEVRELREQMDRIERLLMEVHSKRVVGD